MHLLGLIGLSLLPCVCLLVFILYMDRRQPEPFDLLLQVAGLGAFTVIPAGFLESMLIVKGSFLEGPFLMSFLVIGPIEELCKIWVVFRLAWNHPAFDEENDGIVYTGMAAIGFAAFENLFYVLKHGFAVGVIRAMLSVPMHVVAGVIAGYQIGLARFVPDPAQRRSLIWKGFAGATVLHAVFDYFLLSGKPEIALFVLPLGFFQLWIGFSITQKGRDLSLQRWTKGGSVAAEIDAMDGPPPDPGTGRWKIWVSRSLFALVAGFYGLLALGFSIDPARRWSDLPMLIVGGFILTFIPLGLAVLLEFSWRYHNRRVATAAGPAPTVPSGPGAV